MKATVFFSSTVAVLSLSVLFLAGCAGVTNVSPAPGGASSAPPGGSSAHATFVYVLNASGSGPSISGFRMNPDGTLIALQDSPFSISGNFPGKLAVLRNFLLVPDQENVTSYRIDPSTGSLTRAQTAAAPTGSEVVAEAIAADSKNVYVGGLASGTSVIYAFSIDANGSFTAISRSPFVFSDCVCSPPRSIAVQNSMLFASSTGFPATSSGPLAVYSIQDGALTLKQTLGTDGLWDLAVPPNGHVVYALSSPFGIEGFIFGPDGVLSQSSAITRFLGGSAMTMDPTGKFLATISAGKSDSLIPVYSIDPVTSSLTQFGAPVLTGGPEGDSIAFDPSGRFVVGGAGDGVTVFSFNPASGTMTKIQSAPTSGLPVSIVIAAL
ncbi:MAG TPA: beta-propeller fold lactonase family protein [Candidatus Angelobacter sp.]